MDEEATLRLSEHAYALWQAAGRPEGRDVEFWLQAEQELFGSVAGEEDPLEALDHDALGAPRPPD